LVRQWARPIAETLKHSKRDAIPIVILTVMSLVGTFGMAAFSNHPLLLIFLSARLPFLALASTRLGFFPFLVVSFIRLSLADPFHFRIGRRLGTEIGSELSPAPTRHPGARSILRFGLLGTVFMAPIGRHLMAAGASKLRVRHVIVADVLGTLVYVTLVYFLGSTVITALR
jgi:membrane protein DedA with SNARE-associated domain